MSSEDSQSNLADCLADGQRSEATAVLLRLLEKNGYPISVTLGVTERCNLGCAHCFVPRPDQEDPLGLGELEDLFDELVELGVLFLTITGGEPCLRRDLVEIIAAARIRRFNVTLKTNATKLSEELLVRLREVGLHRIDASLYHDQAEEHDSFVQQAGAWARTMGALDRWVQLGGSSVLSFVAMNWNSERSPAVIELAKVHGFNYKVSPIMTCRTDGDLGPTRFRLESEGLVRLLQDDQLLDPSGFTEPTRRDPEESLCMGGVNQPFIGPEGRVFICQTHPDPLGDLREQSFREIWDGSAVRKKFVETRWRDLPVCSDCELSWICNRCPASAQLEDGDFYGPSRADCAVAEAKSIVTGHPGKRPGK